MNWPNPQDYNEAIQFPSVCFTDRELCRAQIELTALGLPRPITGAFASVYKLKGSAGETWAVRCFHNDIPELERRYTNVLAVLESTNPHWALKTEFIAKGIKVQGRWYPIVKMAWADGLPLDRYIAKHGSNQERVNKLAVKLKDVLTGMQEIGIAHGDLQHGNILVVEDEIKLIDYDGLFVPALTGMQSAELGHANYQHPYRTREHFGSYIDNFPGWLISISLMSIAADPELLAYSKDRECLLFGHADLIKAYESELFTRLLEHPEQEISRAAKTLMKLLNTPVEFVPALDASDNDILELPALDPAEQMRLMDEICKSEPFRNIERPPALSALEKLSATKRADKNKLGQLFRQASAKGSAILSSMLQQRLNSQMLAEKGDSAFSAGRYQEAIQAYVKAVAEIPAEAEAQKKKYPDMERKTISVSMYPEVRKYVNESDFPRRFDYEKFEDDLNLRLGTCQLLIDNAAAAVFHYKSVLKKHQFQPVAVEVLDATVGLMLSYCQLGREKEAAGLIDEFCALRNRKSNTAAFSAQNLSCTLLGYGHGPLSKVTGMSAALKVVAQFFEREGQYEHASSLFEVARSLRGGTGSDEDLDLSLRIGHCHLLNRRPDLALHYFHVIAHTAEARGELHDRAAVAQAVAFKMMNSRQDVVQAMRSRMPENLYNCLKQEVDGPLGDLDELGEVICAFASELGEADIMGGLRLATRLAADNFKRLDDKKLAEQIIQLLNDGKFGEADNLASEEVLAQEGLRQRLAEGALAFARNLTNLGAYEQAFEVLEKYNCPDDLIREAMEGQIIRHIKAATRHKNWRNSDFKDAIAVMEALSKKMQLSDYICQFLAEQVCACPDRSDAFLVDARYIADFMAGHHPDGPSCPQVLKIRMFALNAESPNAPAPVVKPQTSAAAASKLGQQFEKASRSGTVSARSRKMETDVLALLRLAAQSNWEAAKLDEFRCRVDEMKRQRCLTVEFCDKLASSLLDHFTEASGMNRWQKEKSTAISQASRDSIKVVLNSLMDTFATVSGIDSRTLRKLHRCAQKV